MVLESLTSVELPISEEMLLEVFIPEEVGLEMVVLEIRGLGMSVSVELIIFEVVKLGSSEDDIPGRDETTEELEVSEVRITVALLTLISLELIRLELKESSVAEPTNEEVAEEVEDGIVLALLGSRTLSLA